MSNRSNQMLAAVKAELSSLKFTRKAGQDYLMLFLGVVLQAFAMRLFMIPAHLVSGGVAGVSLIINFLTDIPIGLLVFLFNIPLLFLGWRYLGGVWFAFRSLFSIVFFSLFVDLFALFLPESGVTDDVMLNAIYGAILSGIGLGLVFRGKGTTGGTDILGRILNHRLGISISTAYLITDSVVILLGGLVFNWELALYGMGVIYVTGLAAQAAFEGRAVYRCAMIVSKEPKVVSKAVMEKLDRGVTLLFGEGGYTAQKRDVIYLVVTQSEIPRLKDIVQDVDPDALMVIGQVHEALGNGFRALSPEM